MQSRLKIRRALVLSFLSLALYSPAYAQMPSEQPSLSCPPTNPCICPICPKPGACPETLKCPKPPSCTDIEELSKQCPSTCVPTLCDNFPAPRSYDVNGDCLVNDADSKAVIGYLNSGKSGTVSTENSKYDTNKDGVISPLDPLVVTDLINQHCSPKVTPTSTPTPTPPCATNQYVDTDGSCKAVCTETKFKVEANVYKSDFVYSTTGGTRRTCFEEAIRSWHAMHANDTNKDAFQVVTDSNGQFEAKGEKWADDSAADALWTYLSGSTSNCFPPGKAKPKINQLTDKDWACLQNAKSTNYQKNKQYLNCNSKDAAGNYLNTYLHDKSTGWGGGNDTSKYGSTTPACPDGSFVLDADCNLVKQSDIKSACGTKGITGTNYTSFAKSTPLSLIMDASYDINAHVSIARFPINPSAGKSFWIWKGSEQSPLLVYDPEHKGVITSASQLFGNYTFGGKRFASAAITADAAHSTWRDGFEALGSLDADNDGEISGRELEPLALWFDTKSDGISSPGEVRSLKSVGIVALRYSIDVRDSLNHTLESSRGYKRTTSNTVTEGRIIDWSSEGADNHYSLLAHQLAGSGDDESRKLLEPRQMLPNESSRESKLSSAPSISGMWRWKLTENTDSNPIDEGFFVFGERGEHLKGSSLMQLPFNVPGSKGSDTLLSVKFSAISGQVSKEADGSVGLAFTTQVQGSVIFNEATIKPGSEEMHGTSRALVFKEGALTDLTYSWIAKRDMQSK